MTQTIKFAIAGASGRMGRTLIESVVNTPGCKLTGAFDLAGSPSIGRDAGDFMGQSTGVIVSDSIESALTGSDVLIDFTRPEGTIHHLEICCKLGTKIVIGTTGFTPQQLTKLEEASKTISMVWSPNMAVGVNATFKLLEVAAKILSEGYDIEVIEAHHNKKVDAPSGTALRMGEVIAKELGISLSEKGVFAREGITGEREKGTIGFATIRGGDIVGDHTVLFAGTGERIEITHKSSSRSTYAQGSIRAAKFIMEKDKGLFDMQDVLGLKTLKL